MDINSGIDNSDDSVIWINKNSETLFVSFASFYDKGTERFDWNIIRKFDTDALLIRDLSMCWYLCGLKNISVDVESTVDWLNQQISRYSKVFFFGSSMGGYASILYGSLVDHQSVEVHAFSPQVDLSGENKNFNPWTKYYVDENILSSIIEEDLKYLSLHKSVTPPLNTYLHYGNKHPYDVYSCNLLHTYKIEYDTDLHAVARYLHNKDKLIPLLKTVLAR